MRDVTLLFSVAIYSSCLLCFGILCSCERLRCNSGYGVLLEAAHVVLL